MANGRDGDGIFERRYASGYRTLSRLLQRMDGATISLVRPSKRALLVAVLAATMAARATYGASAVTIALAKAADCCARHCDHPHEVPVRPADCCHVATQATDVMRATQTPMLDPGLTLIGSFSPSLAGEFLAFSGHTLLVAAPETGPPPYLRTLSLRL